ncbi:MAG: magnesium transporter [Isosphaeraceae bacterium]|nr:magnesium transporter [Isosphaeraceae bacterium]
MRNPLLVPDLRELLQAGETAALRDFLGDYHPARIAEVIEDLGPEEGGSAFGLLEPRVRAEVMSYLPREEQVRLIEGMSPDDAAALLHLMSHDERADLVNHLDDELVDQILPKLAHAEREDIRRLASYEPGTAGAVMTTDYAALPPHITVREALDRLRHVAPDRETIYYSYVVDAQRRLIGLVSLKNLILARPKARIDEIMQEDIVSARVDEDQESVARKIAQYDLIAIPVVDADDRLVGIVTHDDAMDILRQEQTEDILRFGGVAADPEADEEPYWQARIVEAVRRRIGWLLLLFFGGTITSLVLRHFHWVEGRLHDPAIDLEVFIPLLIGTGGNAGSQSVGTIIRGLALGEIQRGDALRVLLREMLTGLLLGTLLGGLGFFYTWLVLRHPPVFSAVIGLAILGICTWANSVGALVPLLARRLGIDPAVVSAPLISTLVDATGLIIYYTVAIVLLVKLSAT